ncbi:MAG TPA: hypothetical protein VFW40_13025 [Capsulimonadaceae bacterium]|nr:hypothetical protein [Capsulimonadaceae bacterium]
MKTQYKGLKIFACLLLILDIGVHCVRAQTGTPKVLKTQDLQIVNSSGLDMIDMDVSKEGSAIIGLNDPEGNVRMGLLADSSGGHLQMISTAQKTTFAASGDGSPNISFFKNGQMKGEIGLRDDGWPILMLGTTEDDDRVFLGHDPSTQTTIFHLNSKGAEQSAEMASMPKYAVIDATDKQATRRAAIRCDSDGTPLIYVADKDGNPTWSQDDSASQ